MCARFTLITPTQTLADLFGLADVPDLSPRYNVAPTQPVAAVRLSGEGRRMVRLRWGLVPSWAADLKVGNRLLNARSETAAEKPSFRAAFRQRRCLVLADGFYEWLPVRGRKQPFHFRLWDGRPFAFAGLWERWQAPGGEAVESCTILTAEANDLVRTVHDRMPVILPPRYHDDWLDPGLKDAERLRPWLRPFPAEMMTACPVNPVVNSPRSEGPGCLAPASEW